MDYLKPYYYDAPKWIGEGVADIGVSTVEGDLDTLAEGVGKDIGDFAGGVAGDIGKTGEAIGSFFGDIF